MAKPIWMKYSVSSLWSSSLSHRTPISGMTEKVVLGSVRRTPALAATAPLFSEKSSANCITHLPAKASSTAGDTGTPKIRPGCVIQMFSVSLPRSSSTEKITMPVGAVNASWLGRMDTFGATRRLYALTPSSLNHANLPPSSKLSARA